MLGAMDARIYCGMLLGVEWWTLAGASTTGHEARGTRCSYTRVNSGQMLRKCRSFVSPKLGQASGKLLVERTLVA